MIEELQQIVDSRNIVGIDCEKLVEEIGKYAVKYSEDNFTSSNDSYVEQIVATKYNNIKRMLQIDNPELFEKLAGDDTYYIQLPYLSAYELCHRNWHDTVKRVEYKNIKKNTIRTSDAYQCNKCKGKRIFIYEKQTRSADEPMTIFFECQDCPNRWKR